ncbi:unnamed protein product [Staurois parvus]|uniref:Uncharacterized protein n=1 Tax=Staurois parvus TaxID=386267 RepID=A0ABN9HQ78_9NEOB|nr:unnamed protein product [Staurois parvus]
MFDPVFSDPPLLLLFPIQLLIEQSLGGKLHTLKFVFLGKVHMISTGPISTVRIEGQGLCSFIGQSEQNENPSYKI